MSAPNVRKATAARPRRLRRTAQELKAALIQAAGRQFARSGYEQVSVRDIAGEAGLQASLINRYFGSKEGLFRAVLATSPGIGEPAEELAAILGGPATFSRALAEVIGAPETSAVSASRLLILALALRSAGSTAASGIIAEDLDRRFVQPMAEKLGGADAEVRAGVISALVMGLSLCRQHLKTPSLADCPAETLSAVIAPLFEQLASGRETPSA